MPARTKQKEYDIDDYSRIAGTGGKRKGTSPRLPRKNDHGMSLDINLENFEDAVFEGSKYVLTSPRSLEACARINVKPVEMIYKPLIEFQEELIPRGFSMRMIYSIYEEQERERMNKLSICREERQRVIEEEEIADAKHVSPTVFKSSKPAKTQLTRRICRSMDDLINGHFGEKNQDDVATLQRKRTAWTTSIGHQRVSFDEIEKRAQELYEKGKKTKVTPKPRKSVLIKSPREVSKKKVHLTKKQKTKVNKVNQKLRHGSERTALKIMNMW